MFKVEAHSVGNLTGRKSTTAEHRAAAVEKFLNGKLEKGQELVAVLGTSELLLVFKSAESPAKDKP